MFHKKFRINSINLNAIFDHIKFRINSINLNELFDHIKFREHESRHAIAHVDISWRCKTNFHSDLQCHHRQYLKTVIFTLGGSFLH